MGKKYRRRKRILGISAMILAFLIAIYPSFTQAAQINSIEDDRLTVRDSRGDDAIGDTVVNAELEDGEEGIVIIRSADS
ncbi:MAG: hypothetical protein J5966_02070, partial [Lachnospiraceae bacterium]|nr:hypothetical protein [Lachnospiraceae bacterium]